MAYQTILAHLSNRSATSAVLAASEILAKRHAAHLVGLHVKPPLDLFVNAEVPVPINVTRELAEHQRECESTIRKLFEQRSKSRSHVSEWRSVDAGLMPIVDALVEQGNTSDLMVICQNEGAAVGSYFRNIPEHVLMACGRPVLVVPFGEPVISIGERIFVAWDGRRESTRAVFGALPMLRRASLVHLHRVIQPHEDRHQIARISDEMANTLARHGVVVEVFHSDAKNAEVADELLNFANNMDADVIVMGCYGHSPLREFFLGGTTRSILADSTLPLLMSN
jgi:nucleotide-binding universal stress UspA family protein